MMLTRPFTATTVGNLSAAFERLTTLIRSDESALGPSVMAANVIQGLGPAPPIPIVRAQNRFRYAAQLLQARGNHHWNAGAEVVRSHINGWQQDGERKIITFGNDFGRDALTNFRPGKRAPSGGIARLAILIPYAGWTGALRTN
jgi:hypothetical protein